MTGPEAAITVDEWFTAMVDSLPDELRDHYGQLWERVERTGLIWEVQRTTHLLFSARDEWIAEAFEESDPSDQAIFLFALKEAVFDWDI